MCQRSPPRLGDICFPFSPSRRRARHSLAGGGSSILPAMDSIFRRQATLADLNALSEGTAMRPLVIEFTEIGPDYLRATMPVHARTRQPYGLLHGGASVLLAETLGS